MMTIDEVSASRYYVEACNRVNPEFGRVCITGTLRVSWREALCRMCGESVNIKI